MTDIDAATVNRVLTAVRLDNGRFRRCFSSAPGDVWYHPSAPQEEWLVIDSDGTLMKDDRSLFAMTVMDDHFDDMIMFTHVVLRRVDDAEHDRRGDIAHMVNQGWILKTSVAAAPELSDDLRLYQISNIGVKYWVSARSPADALSVLAETLHARGESPLEARATISVLEYIDALARAYTFCAPGSATPTSLWTEWERNKRRCVVACSVWP